MGCAVFVESSSSEIGSVESDGSIESDGLVDDVPVSARISSGGMLSDDTDGSSEEVGTGGGRSWDGASVGGCGGGTKNSSVGMR